MGADNLQYGIRAGYSSEMNFAFPVGASEVFKKKGGGFVTTDASGRIEVAGAATTQVIGWALLNEDFTASATEGGTTLPVNVDLDSVYELPVSGTYAATMRGETCDISVAANVQQANVAASAVDILEIIDAGYTNAAGTVVSVLVKLYRNNLTRQGVV